MNKIIIVLLLSIMTVSADAQDLDNSRKIKTWISFGLNTATGEEFNHVYSVGYNAHFYLGLINFKNLHFGPALNFNYHVKHLNAGAKDQLINLGLGMNANYRIPLNSASLYLGLVAYYDNITDKIKPRKDYSGKTITILTGQGYSYGPKISLAYKKFLFQTTYLIRPLTIEFSSAVISPFTNVDNLYEVFELEKNSQMDFSSITFSIAYEL